MSSQFNSIIKKQEELIAALQEQLKADQVLINSQEKQIRIQTEAIALLKKEQLELTRAGNEMAAASQQLEQICCRQQELLDSFLSEQ